MRRIKSILLAVVGILLGAGYSPDRVDAQCPGGICYPAAPPMIYQPQVTYQPARLIGYTYECRRYGLFGMRCQLVPRPVYQPQAQQPQQPQPVQPEYRQWYRGPTAPQWQGQGQQQPVPNQQMQRVVR